MQQISIETAQSDLDTAVLETLPGKTIILGVLDLSTHAVEEPETVAARIRKALPHVDGRSGSSSRPTAGSSTSRARSPSAR